MTTPVTSSSRQKNRTVASPRQSCVSWASQQMDPSSQTGHLPAPTSDDLASQEWGYSQIICGLFRDVPIHSNSFRSLLGLLLALARALRLPIHVRTDLGALQFAQGVGRNPARTGGVAGADALSSLDRQAVQPGVALADLPQCPVDRFAHVSAVVVGLALDHRQQ